MANADCLPSGDMSTSLSLLLCHKKHNCIQQTMLKYLFNKSTKSVQYSYEKNKRMCDRDKFIHSRAAIT